MKDEEKPTMGCVPPKSHGEVTPLGAVAPKCWKQTRTSPEAFCDKLSTFGHCRNCPEYLHSGRNLLNREIPPELLKELTEELSQEKAEKVKNSFSILAFQVFDELLALETKFFKEISGIRFIHSIPARSNKQFLGLVNIKGTLLPCISLESILGIASTMEIKASKDPFHRMIVVEKEGGRFVFPVHVATGIFRITPSDVKEVPPTVSKSHSFFSKGVVFQQGKSLDILDEEKLFPAFERSLNP